MINFYRVILTLAFMLLLPLLPSAKAKAQGGHSDNSESLRINEPSIMDLQGLLLNAFPLFSGQEDWFEEVQSDSELRKKVNAIIESDPVLREAAEQGLKFRNEYVSIVKEHASDADLGYLLSPQLQILRDLELEIYSQKQSMILVEMNEDEAARNALADTHKRFALPKNWSISKITSNNFMHGEFYKDRYQKYLRKDVLNQNKNVTDVKSWKKQKIEMLNSLREKSFKKFFERYKKRMNRNLSFEIDQINTPGLFEIPTTSVEISIGDLLKSKVLFSMIDEDKNLKSTHFNWTVGKTWVSPEWEISEILDTTKQLWLLFPFRMKTKDKRDFVSQQEEKPELINHENERELIGFVFQETQKNIHLEEYLSKNKRTLWLKYKNFQRLLRSIKTSNSNQNNERLKADSKYMSEFAMIDGHIKDAQKLIHLKEDRNLKDLHRRFYREVSNQSPLDLKNSSQSIQQLVDNILIFSEDDIPIKKTKPTKVKQVSLTEHIKSESNQILSQDNSLGIKWYGYQINASYWELRDQVASKLKRPHYSTMLNSDKIRRKGLFSRLRSAYTDIVGNATRRYKTFMGSAVLVTYIALATSAMHLTYEYGGDVARYVKENIPKITLNRPSQGDFVESTDEGTSDNYDNTFVGTVSADAMAKAGGKASFSVEVRNQNVELPHYFIMSPINQIRNPLNFNKEKNQIKLSNYQLNNYDNDPDIVVRLGAPRSGDTPIPSFLDYELTAIQVKTHQGKQLDHGYTVKFSADHIYNLDLHSGYESTEISYAAYYRYKEKPRYNYALDKIFELKLINNDLRSVGFDIIADEIDEHITRNGSILITELSDIIGKVSFYTYRQPVGPFYGVYGETFASVSRFLRNNCLYGQCSSGNELFHLYVERYAELTSEPMKSARTVGYYWDQSTNQIIGADKHRFSRVYIGDQGFFVHADATPMQMDEIDKKLKADAMNSDMQEENVNDKAKSWLNRLNQYKNSLFAALRSYLSSNSESSTNKENDKGDKPSWYVFDRQKKFQLEMFDDPSFDDEVNDYKNLARKKILEIHNDYDKKILQNEIFRKLSLHLRKELPVSALYVTINALTDLRLMRSSYSLAIKKIRNVFPNMPLTRNSLSEPEILKELLNAIYDYYNENFDSVRLSASENSLSKKYRALASSSIHNPILNLLYSIKSSDWSPVDAGFFKKTNCFTNFDELKTENMSGFH